MKALVVVYLSGAIAATTPELAAWTVDEKASELGAPRWTALVDSTNELPNTIGVPRKATLILRCTGGQLDVYVAWPAYMGTTTRKAVRWKFDDGPVQSADYWSPSEGGTALFYDKGAQRDVYDFAKQITRASKLVIGASPYQRAEQEAVFDLTGAEELAEQGCLKGMLGEASPSPAAGPAAAITPSEPTPPTPSPGATQRACTTQEAAQKRIAIQNGYTLIPNCQ